MRKENVYFASLERHSQLSYRESADQSGTFTKHHVRYCVTIKRQDNGKKLSFEYQCNRKAKPNFKDCLYCYITDASAYEYCCDDIDEFASEIGYEKISDCLKAFKACKNAYIDLIEFCGNTDSYEALKAYFERY